jgi:hypothetical protein
VVPIRAREEPVERHAPAQRRRVHVHRVLVLDDVAPARRCALRFGSVGGVEVVAGGGVVQPDEAHGAGDLRGEEARADAFGGVVPRAVVLGEAGLWRGEI